MDTQTCLLKFPLELLFDDYSMIFLLFLDFFTILFVMFNDRELPGYYFYCPAIIYNIALIKYQYNWPLNSLMPIYCMLGIPYVVFVCYDLYIYNQRSKPARQQNRWVSFKVNNNDIVEWKQVDRTCSICFASLSDIENLCKLTCGHIDHFDCMTTWLNKNPRCPRCSQVVIEH